MPNGCWGGVNALSIIGVYLDVLDWGWVVELRVLGPAAVVSGGSVVAVGTPAQCAALAVDAGRLVPVEVLVDRVCVGESPARSARPGCRADEPPPAASYPMSYGCHSRSAMLSPDTGPSQFGGLGVWSARRLLPSTPHSAYTASPSTL
jgi:hypothetical protein